MRGNQRTRWHIPVAAVKRATFSTPDYDHGGNTIGKRRHSEILTLQVQALSTCLAYLSLVSELTFSLNNPYLQAFKKQNTKRNVVQQRYSFCCRFSTLFRRIQLGSSETQSSCQNIPLIPHLSSWSIDKTISCSPRPSQTLLRFHLESQFLSDHQLSSRRHRFLVAVGRGNKGTVVQHTVTV